MHALTVIVPDNSESLKDTLALEWVAMPKVGTASCYNAQCKDI